MRAFILPVTLLFSTACLSSSHKISKGELVRLSQIAPEQRAQQVRVVQEIGDSGPPAQQPVDGQTRVYVHSPIWVGGRPHRRDYYDQRNTTVDHRGGSGAAPTTNLHTGGSSRGTSNALAAAKVDDAKAWIVLAALITAGLVFTEGARYDGWVNLHPMHPVHLYGPNGERVVLPLAHIDQQTAQWARYAVVSDREGPWNRVRRAPLDRQGLTWSMYMGRGEIPVDGTTVEPGFLSHIQFGYFPTQHFGLQVDLGLGWSKDANDATIYTFKPALEGQYFLAQAGPVHAGIFGQVGTSNRLDDGIQQESESILLGGGGLLQLDITTRLALTGRFGATQSFGEWSKEFALGVSIY